MNLFYLRIIIDFFSSQLIWCLHSSCRCDLLTLVNVGFECLGPQMMIDMGCRVYWKLFYYLPFSEIE